MGLRRREAGRGERVVYRWKAPAYRRMIRFPCGLFTCRSSARPHGSKVKGRTFAGAVRFFPTPPTNDGFLHEVEARPASVRVRVRGGEGDDAERRGSEELCAGREGARGRGKAVERRRGGVKREHLLGQGGQAGGQHPAKGRAAAHESETRRRGFCFRGGAAYLITASAADLGNELIIRVSNVAIGDAPASERANATRTRTRSERGMRRVPLGSIYRVPQTTTTTTTMSDSPNDNDSLGVRPLSLSLLSPQTPTHTPPSPPLSPRSACPRPVPRPSPNPPIHLKRMPQKSTN